MLRTFAEISGLNVVIDTTIQGTVDVALRDVPWDQALDIILRSNGLDYEVEGAIVRIAPVTVFRTEDEERRARLDAQANAVELATRTFDLSYANGNPQIDTQSATTKVLVSDGETTVLGGIYVSSESTTQDRTPGLSRIPLLGWLFKRDAVVDSSEELLIFITPRIMKLEERPL